MPNENLWACRILGFPSMEKSLSCHVSYHLVLASSYQHEAQPFWPYKLSLPALVNIELVKKLHENLSWNSGWKGSVRITAVQCQDWRGETWRNNDSVQAWRTEIFSTKTTPLISRIMILGSARSTLKMPGYIIHFVKNEGVSCLQRPILQATAVGCFIACSSHGAGMDRTISCLIRSWKPDMTTTWDPNRFLRNMSYLCWNLWCIDVGFRNT